MAVAPTIRPRLVNDDHADVKSIPGVCAQGLDDEGFCQGDRIWCEKERRRVQEGSEWNDFFCFPMIKKTMVTGRETYTRHDLGLAGMGLTKVDNLRKPMLRGYDEMRTFRSAR